MMAGPERRKASVSEEHERLRAELEIGDLRADYEVRLWSAVSERALDFVTPMALGAVCENTVYRSNDQLASDRRPLHVVARDADALVLHPATARIIAQCALGEVTCAVTRLFAFTPKDRVVVAPAIHPYLERSIYEPHVRRLRDLGCTVLGGDDLFASWADVRDHLCERLALKRRTTPWGPVLLKKL